MQENGHYLALNLKDIAELEEKTEEQALSNSHEGDRQAYAYASGILFAIEWMKEKNVYGPIKNQ